MTKNRFDRFTYHFLNESTIYLDSLFPYLHKFYKNDPVDYLDLISSLFYDEIMELNLSGDYNINYIEASCGERLTELYAMNRDNINFLVSNIDLRRRMVKILGDPRRYIIRIISKMFAEYIKTYKV